jgi:hypothetical protein
MAERDLVSVTSAVLIAARVSLMSLQGTATDGHQVPQTRGLPVITHSRISVALGRDNPSYSVRSWGEAFDALNAGQNLSIRFNSQNVEMHIKSYLKALVELFVECSVSPRPPNPWPKAC